MSTKTMKKLVISGIFFSMMLILAFAIPSMANAQYYYTTYGNCTYHAYKLCSGNNIYWYDSCGNQQDLFSSCYNGLVCQYGRCVNYVAPVQPIQPTPNYGGYVAHYQTTCYNNSVYWYDTLGVLSGLYKNCNDNNTCTKDTCYGDKCINTLKCDGSTCALNSVDYATYCAQTAAPQTAQNNCGNGLCETTLGETTANCQADCKINIVNASVAFFAKQDANSTQWQKTAEIGSNGKIYFMISVINNSSTQIDNVAVSTNIPTEISSLGNLQLNGVAVTGDIVAGINIGSVASNSTKSITFEGLTQNLPADSATKEATAKVKVAGGTEQTDAISIKLVPGQVLGAAVSDAPATSSSGIKGLFKHWYSWVIAAIVLIFLFVVVFKRLSSDV